MSPLLHLPKQFVLYDRLTSNVHNIRLLFFFVFNSLLFKIEVNDLNVNIFAISGSNSTEINVLFLSNSKFLIKHSF